MMVEELTSPTTAKLPIRAFADHLRLGTGFADDGSEDVMLEICLRSALSAIEARIGKALIKRKFKWQVTRWHDGNAQAFPIAPIVEIHSVNIVRDEVEDLVSPNAYHLEKDSQRPIIRGFLPTIPNDGHAEIVFDAGFGSWAVIPPDLRQAVLLMAASFYENRSGETKVDGLPFAVSALLDRYRPMRLGAA